MSLLFRSALVFGLFAFFAVRIVLSPFEGNRLCRDGWHSSSIGTQGACSWHGGVGGLDRGNWVWPLSLAIGIAAGLWRASQNEKHGQRKDNPSERREDSRRSPTPIAANPPTPTAANEPAPELPEWFGPNRREVAKAKLAAHILAERERAAS